MVLTGPGTGGERTVKDKTLVSILKAQWLSTDWFKQIVGTRMKAGSIGLTDRGQSDFMGTSR